MTNHESQELKPVYIQDARHGYNDEISLIDLTLILVKRKWLIILTIVISITLGLATTFFITKKYTYSTSLEIGNHIIEGKIFTFESHGTIQSKLQYSFIPQAIEQLRRENTTVNLQVTSRVPKNSSIIVLEHKGDKDQTEIVEQLLKKITTIIINDHNRIYQSLRQSLESRINKIKAELQSLQLTNSSPVEAADLQHTLNLLSSQLDSLRNTQEISPPMRSHNAIGTSKKLILAVSTFVGLFAGIFLAFFAEFISKVRERMQHIDDSAKPSNSSAVS